MRFRVGQAVRVRQGAGLDTGREGIVVPKRLVLTDGHGVPRLGQGHYKPLAASDYAVRDTAGRLFTMANVYLEPVEEGEV